LGRVFTEIYDQKMHITARQLPNLQLTEELQLIVLEKERAGHHQAGRGRIFVLTAGMLTESTPAHDLALRMMDDARQAIFFVGYADPGTPGGRLKASKPGEPSSSAPPRGSEAPLRSAGIRFDRARQPGRAAGFRRPCLAQGDLAWARRIDVPAMV
jgi:Cft2 family RNA processing exonuclease